MNDEIKEILEHLSATQKINNGWISFSIEECKGLYDYITNLEQVADTRMKTLLKIEQYLIDSGVDDEILECCDIYDVNGVELRKYIEKLKEGKE